MQLERVVAGRDVAVDQHDVGDEALVVVLDPVDHERRPVVGGLRLQHQVLVAVPLARHVRAPGRLHELRGHVALEDVAEARREGEVDVEEVRHVDDVVDDLAAVRRAGRRGRSSSSRCRRRGSMMSSSSGGSTSWSAGLPSGSCQTISRPLRIDGLVLLGARAQRDPAGVGDRLALAVAAPAPVVERAGDLVALHGALGQVAAHVPAVAVEHVELAVGALPDHELAAEALDGVRLAVARTGSPGRGSATRARTAPAPCRGRAIGLPWSARIRVRLAALLAPWCSSWDPPCAVRGQVALRAQNKNRL